MDNGDWYLGYSSYGNLPGAALTFGSFASGLYCLSVPKVAFADPDVGDQPLPGEDGVRMGRDYQRSATVTFELGVDTVDTPANRRFPAGQTSGGQLIGDWSNSPLLLAKLRQNGTPESWNGDAVAMMRQVWRADSVRARAGRVAWLRHKRGGHIRTLYGRPRRFAPASSDLSAQGYTPAVADFVAVDDRFYDDTAKTAELWDNYMQGWRPVRPGRPGWESPVVPAPARRSTLLVVSGELPVHPVITIHGPCANPKVTLGKLWAVQLSLTLKSGEYVTVNAQPWARTAMKYTASGSSASVADRLTRASPRLAEMTLPPGRWMATLDFTRSSTFSMVGPRVVITWRDAYAWW